jgi:hypothetical protein
MLRSRLLELLSPICLTYFYSQTERVFLTPRGYPGTIFVYHRDGHKSPLRAMDKPVAIYTIFHLRSGTLRLSDPLMENQQNELYSDG